MQDAAAKLYRPILEAAIEMTANAPAGRSALHDQAAALLQALTPAEDSSAPQPPPGALLRREIAVLPHVQEIAVALQPRLRQPTQQQELEMQAALVSARRACSYLRCPNVGAEGGMAAGEQAGSAKCSACRVSWFW